MVYKWLVNNLHHLYPPICALCQWRVVDRTIDLCSGCEADLPENSACCRVCADAIAPGGAGLICGRCQKDPPAFCSSLVPWRFDPPMDYLVHEFKYAGQLSLARVLGELFATRARQLPVVPDLLLPVPLHRRRLQERGFNQAWQLCRVVASRLALNASDKHLVRHRDTPSQAGLDAATRRRNLRNAFTLRGPVQGLRIALMDDVVTTGSTARVIAQLLHARGADHVQVWAIARA